MDFFEINTPEEYGYSIKTKINNITTEVKFMLEKRDEDIEYYWVELWSYKKKKDADKNMNNMVTFSNGISRLLFARNAIQDFILFTKEMDISVAIVVHWSDNRRRDVYTRGLKSMGFKMERYNEKMCLVYRE